MKVLIDIPDAKAPSLVEEMQLIGAGKILALSVAGCLIIPLPGFWLFIPQAFVKTEPNSHSANDRFAGSGKQKTAEVNRIEKRLPLQK
jgi:hypothetical protein